MQNQNSQNILAEGFNYLFDKRVSIVTKLIFAVVVLGYGLFPLDIIPDIFLPFGLIDDGGVILTAITFFVRKARVQVMEDSDLTEEEKQVVRSQSSSGGNFFVGCGIFLLIIMIAIGAVIGWGLYTGTQSIVNVMDNARDFINGEPTANTIIGDIELALNSQGTLVTHSASAITTGARINVATGVLGACRYGASYSAAGTIEAGMQLTGIASNDIVYDPVTREFTVTLPPVEITSCRIDSIDQYDSSFNYCFQSFDDVRQIAQAELTSEFLEDALDDDILFFAEQDAINVLDPLLGSFTTRTINFEFAPSSDPVIDESCQPTLPETWYYDSISGRYTTEE